MVYDVGDDAVSLYESPRISLWLRMPFGFLLQVVTFKHKKNSALVETSVECDDERGEGPETAFSLLGEFRQGGTGVCGSDIYFQV
jgi:hypothetical protein